MLRNFEPNKMTNNIYTVKKEYLLENDLKGIITDLDNTLIPWDHVDATEELIDWLAELSSGGIQIVICSNNNEGRVKEFADKVGLPFVSKAYKPFGGGFKRALSLINLSANEVLVLGDQLMTDVLGGNRRGMHTVLVEPLVKTDEWRTRINRSMERRILKYLQRKGRIN